VEVRSERFTRPGLGGVTLAAIHFGDPSLPPLVLLHGAGANAHWWDHLAPRLARDFHVVALDFRGHGASDFPEALLPGAFRDDLEALLEHLGDPDAALVGHSLGAHVALGHAAACPGTRALVLLDPSRGASASRKRATRLALSLRPTYAGRADALERFQFLPAPARVDEALRAAIAEHSVREEADGRFGFRFDPRWFVVPDRERADPRRVAAPTLILRGAESPLLTAEGAAALAGEIPNARLVEIPGAGHHLQLERPDACLAALEPFLRAHHGGAERRATLGP
jgi:pimeloyl-ACP methyl ester carboxylesterase